MNCRTTLATTTTTNTTTVVAAAAATINPTILPSTLTGREENDSTIMMAPILSSSSSHARRKFSLTRRGGTYNNKNHMIHSQVPLASSSSASQQEPKLSLSRRIVRTLRSLSASRRQRYKSRSKSTDKSHPTNTSSSMNYEKEEEEQNKKNTPFLLEILPDLIVKPSSSYDTDHDTDHESDGKKKIHNTTTTTSWTPRDNNLNNHMKKKEKNKLYFLQGTWANPNLYTILDRKKNTCTERHDIHHHPRNTYPKEEEEENEDNKEIQIGEKKRSSSSLQLLQLLLQTDIQYHQTIRNIQLEENQWFSKKKHPSSPWEETVQGYIKIMYILMTFIQNQWKEEWWKYRVSTTVGIKQKEEEEEGKKSNRIHSHEKKFRHEDDDFIGSKRDFFLYQLQMLRLVKKNKQEDEDETPIVSNKKNYYNNDSTPLLSSSTLPYMTQKEEEEVSSSYSSSLTLVNIGSSSSSSSMMMMNKNYHQSYSSIVDSKDIQILLSALADIFIRLANVSIRDGQEINAIQYLQDARFIQNLPLLNVNWIVTHLGLGQGSSSGNMILQNYDDNNNTPKRTFSDDTSNNNNDDDDDEMNHDCNMSTKIITPTRESTTTTTNKIFEPLSINDNLSPISMKSTTSSPTPAAINVSSSSFTMNTNETDISRMLSPSSSSSIINETSMFVMTSSLVFNTMTQDQQRIHTQTMHNFILLLSLYPSNKNNNHPSQRQYQPKDIIHQYDNILQMYSDCLRWKRRTLRELEMEKKNSKLYPSSNTSTLSSSFAYKITEMSYTRTLVNIGTIKAQRILLKPPIQSSPGTVSPSKENTNYQVPFSSSYWTPTSATITSFDIQTSSSSSSPRDQERWSKAERFLKQALSLRVQYHGLEDRDVASALVSLGDVYFIQGKLDMAIRSYQEVIRIRMALKEENLLFTAMTWYNLAVAQYRMGHYGYSRESAARALMIRMKHVDNVESIGKNMASILYVLGMAQSSLGEYDDARKNFNRALVIRKKLFPQDHLLILNVIMTMGIDFLNEAKWDEATSSLTQVYCTRSLILGYEHPLSLEALYFLALVIRDKGEDLSVVLDMLNVVLEGRTKHVGNGDAKTIDIMCSLAESYRLGRLWENALVIINQAIKISAQNFGKEHVIYANTLRVLGEIQLEQGDIDESLNSFQHVIEIHMIPANAATVTVLQTSDTWQRMGHAYFQKAEYQFSSQAYTESLKLKAECISHSDPSFWRLLSVLGQAQYKCGDLKGALDSFTESLQCQSHYYLQDTPSDTAFSKSIVLMALEKIREKMQTLRLKAVCQIEEDLEHFAITLNVLGIINQEMGNLIDAIESFDLCFLARNIKPSRDYEALGHTADKIGLLYFGTGEHQKALSAFRDALSIKESGIGEKSLEAARTLNNMGNVYFAKGNLDEAIDHYNQSYQIKKQVLGSNHEEVANTLNNIAHVLFKSDRLEESFKTYVDVFQMRRILYGDDSLAIAATYCNIGDVRVQLGKLEEAKDCFERCLKIRAIHKCSNYEDNVRIMESLARVEGKLGSWFNATTLYHSAIEIRKNHLGQEKTETLSKTYQLLAHSLIEQRQYNDALPHLYEALRIRTLYILSSSSDEISDIMQVINFCKAKQQQVRFP